MIYRPYACQVCKGVGMIYDGVTSTDPTESIYGYRHFCLACGGSGDIRSTKRMSEETDKRKED